MNDTILVTGGAGFIGSNFVLQWMEAVGSPIVNLDRLTYAGNPENLDALQAMAPSTGARRHLRRGAVRRAVARAPAARDRAFRRREPCGPFHCRPGRFRPHQRAMGRSRCSKQAQGVLVRRSTTEQRGIPLPARLHR